MNQAIAKKQGLEGVVEERSPESGKKSILSVDFSVPADRKNMSPDERYGTKLLAVLYTKTGFQTADGQEVPHRGHYATFLRQKHY